MLRRFQRYFSHITETDYIFIFSWVSPVKCWDFEVSCPRTLPLKSHRGSRAAQTRGLQFTSQTFYHMAMLAPSEVLTTVRRKTLLKRKKIYSYMQLNPFSPQDVFYPVRTSAHLQQWDDCICLAKKKPAFVATWLGM